MTSGCRSETLVSAVGSCEVLLWFEAANLGGFSHGIFPLYQVASTSVLVGRSRLYSVALFGLYSMHRSGIHGWPHSTVLRGFIPLYLASSGSIV